MDGNGRTGRMILNCILLKNNYPPLIIHTKTRSEYLKILRIADSSKPEEAKIGHYQELAVFSSDELTKTYWNIFL